MNYYNEEQVLGDDNMTDTNGIDCIETPYYVDVIMLGVVARGVVRASFEHDNYRAQTPIIYASLSIYTSLLFVPY